MAGRSKRTSFDFEVGTAFNQQLVNDIVEAATPKETRIQAQKQDALKVLAALSSRIAEFAPEEKKKFYNQYFFPAFGVYHPPRLRKLFGAKSETILPLPRGAEEIPTELEGMKMLTPFGKRRELKAGLTLPEQAPMKFLRPPFIQPEEEEELKQQAAKLYPDSPEDQTTWINTQKTALVSKIRPSREDVMWESFNRAERMVDAYKASHPEASDEEAISSLPSNLRRRYQEHVEDVAVRKTQREALTEDIGARKTEREERMGLLNRREKRAAQQQAWYQDFQERKLALMDQWKKLAGRGKTPQQVYRDALTAYSTYSKNLQAQEKEHNRMEMGFAKLDTNYIPARFSEPRLTFEDWLRSDGMMFYERILDMEGKGGEGGEGKPAPTIPPKRREEKASEIDQLKKELNW